MEKAILSRRRQRIEVTDIGRDTFSTGVIVLDLHCGRALQKGMKILKSFVMGLANMYVCVCIYFCDYSVSFEDVSQAVYYVFFFAGGCRCHPGYYGDNCSAVCPEGRYGCGCRSTCRCPGNQTTCNPVTGQCHCPPGFTGLSCESSESPLSSPLMTSPFTRNVCTHVCMCARVSVRVWELWVYHAASLVNLLFGISGE